MICLTIYFHNNKKCSHNRYVQVKQVGIKNKQKIMRSAHKLINLILNKRKLVNAAECYNISYFKIYIYIFYTCVNN
jgi:hypothetical protein